MKKINGKMLRMTALCASLSLLSACGGGGGEGGAPGTPTGSATGTLTDSPVAGVQYTTSSGGIGFTNAEGKFTYQPGDTVTFKIGGLTLGTVTAAGSDATITPLQIAESVGGLSEGQKQNLVTNLLVLLQSLDSDGDAANGISIATTTAAALTSTTAAALDLAADPVAFSADADLIGLLGTAGLNQDPVDPADALLHFKTQFLKDLAGVYTLDLGDNQVIAFRFNSDGSYLMAEVATADGAGQPGIERGRIDWDPLTGEILAANVTFDTNGEWGLSHMVAEKLYLSLNGETLAVRVDAADPDSDETLQFSRLNSGSGIAGPWALNSYGVPAASLSVQQFLFLGNGKYLMIDPVGDDDYAEPDDPKCGDAGLEYGSYTLAGGVLTASAIIADTNGCAGLYDNVAEAYSSFDSVVVDGVTGTVSAGDETLLVRPDTSTLVYAGQAEVTATTTGTPVSQEGGAYTLFCSPGEEVGDMYPLEALFTFNAEAGTFAMVRTDEGALVEVTGTYNAATGAMSWQENEERRIVMDTGSVVFYTEEQTVYTATYDIENDSVTGGWTDTRTTSWDRDGSEVSCTADVEFSVTTTAPSALL